MKRIISLIIFMTTIIVGLISNKGLVTKKINKGIEFSGGIEVLTRVENTSGGAIDIEDVAKVIAKRIDVAGVKNPQIDIETGSDENGKRVQKIRTTLAGVKSDKVDSLTEMITSQGLITFRDVNDRFLAKGTDFLAENGASLAFQEGTPIVSLKVKDKSKIRDISLSIKDRVVPNNKMAIWIDYDPKTDSYKKWNEYQSSGQCATSKVEEINKLCQKVISAASVTNELNSDIIITGGFTTASARELASYINSGSFEYKMTVEETNYVNGAFGEDAFKKAIKASKVAIFAVGIFMIGIYGLGGLMSLISLLLYLFAVLATFNWLGGEYGPDTIAALVVGFGMAADASIILFERFKDELLKGRKIDVGFEQSTKKSLSSILDANITTFIVAFILFQFGSRTVKGFAIMLSLSIFWTIIIVVLLTRFNLSLLVKSKLLQNKKHWFGVKRKHIPNTYQQIPNYKGIWQKFNFIKNAHKFLAISIMIIGFGFTIVGSIGTKNSIQFTGGTRISVHTPIRISDTSGIEKTRKDIANTIKSISSDVKFDNVVTGYNKESNYTLTYNTKTDLNTKWKELKQKLNTKYSDYKFTTSSISSNVAKDTLKNAISSMFWAIIAIIGYITVRFKWTYAIASIIAIAHDALIVYGLFALFRIKINVAFISAILAIIGYSINDTIVSFDRIREKMFGRDPRSITKQDIIKVVNQSIRQTATRSLFTTITTLLAVLSLLFLGPKASFEFNIAMLIGLIVGTYSSIWIAANIWIKLEEFRLKKAKTKKTRRLPKIPNEPDENIFIGVND